MLVTIVVMSKDLTEVSLDEGATLMEALVKASITPESVNDAKRNGVSLSLSSELRDGDSILVFTGSSKKITGGLDCGSGWSVTCNSQNCLSTQGCFGANCSDGTQHPGFVVATFNTITEGETPRKGGGIPVEGTKVLDIAMIHAKAKNIPLMSLSKVLVNWEEKKFTDYATDGEYTLVLKRNDVDYGYDDDDDDEDRE